MTHHSLRSSLACILPVILALVMTGCVNIQTGAETEEQLTQSSELRGRDFRVTWVNRFTGMTPVEKGQMYNDLIDSVSSVYLRYGFNIVGEWQKGNAGRGQLIPDAEMQKVVEASVRTQKPMFQSYEDALEYAYRQLDESGTYSASDMEIFKRHLDELYRIYSVVFYPSGTVDDYEMALRDLESNQRSLSQSVVEMLDRYR